jgi:hypothetical protein
LLIEPSNSNFGLPRQSNLVMLVRKLAMTDQAQESNTAKDVHFHLLNTFHGFGTVMTS